MPRTYDVKITLISQRKKCPMGHKIGDSFIVKNRTPGGMCMGAFSSLLPYITTMRYGGSFPWEKNEDVAMMCCPDPEVVNVFRLERIARKGSGETDGADKPT